jgi:hypothetical protein
LSIRSNVIISTVTALCVSNAIVLLLCAWLQCTPCGSRQSSFVHNAPSFEPAAIPDAAGSGLHSSSSQRLLYPDVASIFSSEQLTNYVPIMLAEPPVPAFQLDKVDFHPGTGPPVTANSYLYIYRYTVHCTSMQKNTLRAAAFKTGAFDVVGSFSRMQSHTVIPNSRYVPDYSFQYDIA